MDPDFVLKVQETQPRQSNHILYQGDRSFQVEGVDYQNRTLTVSSKRVSPNVSPKFGNQKRNLNRDLAESNIQVSLPSTSSFKI